MKPAAIAADALRLCDRFAELTDVPGEITRLFLSPATAALHTLLRAEMDAVGMTVTTDRIGNLRGVYAGTDPGAGTLLLGSHVDTVPNAGRFDGLLGVALPLALLRALATAGRRLPYAIELVCFSEEEGIRFSTPFLGSRGFVGELVPADWQRTDRAGITVAEAARHFGCAEAPLPGLRAGTFAFVEVHLEQGPVLEKLGMPLAVVDTIVGQTRLLLRFLGEANHAGTTPMALRRDALTGAAEWMLATEALARSTPGLVATNGMVEARPGAVNIIAGETRVSLDVRHADDQTRLRAVAELLVEARRIAEARGLEVRVRRTSSQASVPMSSALGAMLARAAEEAGYPAHRMHSGAGHDSMILAPHVPTAMLFVRTPGGLSHHPDEAVTPADVEAAAATLMALLDGVAG